MNRRESGFTLLEMLVVLAIMGLIIGLVAMRGTDRARLTRLPTAAQNLADQLRLARMQAIRTDENFSFTPPREGVFTVEGSKLAVFGPSGAATAARFILHDDTRTIAVTVDALTGRVEVHNGP